VILNWNGGEMVCETIATVLSTDARHTSVIVVDNDSTDGSDMEILRRFPQITLIRNPTNLGFAAGNNVGIRYALEQGTDYVLLLNNDALLDTSAIRVMAAALQPDPNRGIIVPKIFVYPSGEKKRLWAAGAQWRTFPPRVKMRGYGDIDVGQYDRPGVVEYATACALLIRRETFQRAGLLDESYFVYQEDYDFCDRVRASGMTLWYEPAAVVHHHVSASTGEGSAEKWRYWSEGIARFYIQHYGNRSRAIVPLTTFLLWAIMRELAKGRLRWLEPFWQGFRAGWNELR
jgi:GT2 family glycosyltransferase